MAVKQEMNVDISNLSHC